mmetsp:Transcript_132776/g.331239  ORF Transcript_132776/g.331239 Transcript_132776/m.331239 type:complete len:247 (+) Transcript_132776:380-1120(+)
MLLVGVGLLLLLLLVHHEVLLLCNPLGLGLRVLLVCRLLWHRCCRGRRWCHSARHRRLLQSCLWSNRRCRSKMGSNKVLDTCACQFIEATSADELVRELVEVADNVFFWEGGGFLDLSPPTHEDVRVHLLVSFFVEMRFKFHLNARNCGLRAKRVQDRLSDAVVGHRHHSTTHRAVFFDLSVLALVHQHLATRVFTAVSPFRPFKPALPIARLLSLAFAFALPFPCTLALAPLAATPLLEFEVFAL